jgi:hypothetical protein
MGPVVRRPRSLAWVWLLVAVLAAVGVLVPAPAVTAGAGVPDAGVAVGGAPSEALAPSRAMGRVVTEPSLVRVHGPDDGGLSGTLPPGPSRADLRLVGDQPARGAAASGVVSRGMAGLRGPPNA